jgi:hypothetical protein
MGVPRVAVSRIVVQEWTDTNMAGYKWSWQVWVSRRKDGTFSVGAKQFVVEPPAIRVTARCHLKSGAEIFAAIEAVVDATGYNLGREPSVIEGIAAKIRVFGELMADEFREAGMAGAQS